MRVIKSRGLIKQLSEEMVETAKSEAGYCDSDDDTDEEDNASSRGGQQPQKRVSVAGARHRAKKRSSTTFSAYRKDRNLHVPREHDHEHDRGGAPPAEAGRHGNTTTNPVGVEMRSTSTARDGRV